jgi:two-component system, NtrC family, response regulator
MKQRLLILDDSEDNRAQLNWALNQEYDLLVAADAAEGVKMLKESRPLVALVGMTSSARPDDAGPGLAIISELLAVDRLIKTIVIVGESQRHFALQAMDSGAYDFLVMPVQMEEVRMAVKRALHTATLERDHMEFERRFHIDSIEGILGSSKAMQQAFASIRKVSTTDAPVLIRGESGTGKELAALVIHRRSARKAGPFITFNCGAIPESLIETELFGQEAGAFAGAHTLRRGRIERAAGGTLFLDEVGELTPALQFKLLRFLQEQTIERVGGRELVPVDARVIAATQADLRKAMIEGRFREDLYYRLAIVVVQLPPLREREDDVLLLARAFLNRYASEIGKSAGLKFTRPALVALLKNKWPGNVRQLENCVRRAVIMAEGRYVTEIDLGLGTVASKGAPAPRLREARENVERDLVQRALQAHAGNISAAAAELGISRPTLYELIDKLGMRRTEFNNLSDRL